MELPDLSTDGALLTAFVETRSEVAFAAVLQRHEAMVLGVCLRVLDRADAEDAAQAVFLTLAHKASSLKREGSIAGWLHRVAWQVALNMRKSAAARQRHEREATVHATESETEITAWNNLKEVLDREVAALPARYREPLLLHHFDQLTQEQTARMLGEKTGTIFMRLNRAREMLRERLSAHGVALSSTLVAELVAKHAASAHLTAAASGATVKAAVLISVGSKAAAGAIVSSKTSALTSGALSMLFLARLKIAALLAAGVILIAAAASHDHFTTHADEQGPAPTPNPVARAEAAAAFVPKGGKLSAAIPIAKRFPWAHNVDWNPEGTKVLVTIDHRWKENRGSLSREGPDECDSYVVDIATKNVEKKFENEGTPKWLADGRLLLVLKGKPTIVEADGQKHELQTKDYFYPCVSHDGKYVAYYSFNKGEEYHLAPLMLYSVADRSVKELQPPADDPAPAGAKLFRQIGFWNDENRLCVGTTWVVDPKYWTEATWKISLYSPATGAYEHAEYYRNSPKLEQYTRSRDNRMLTGGIWLNVLGPKDWVEPPPPPPSIKDGSKPGMGGDGKGGDGPQDKLAKPAVTITLNTESGKELRRVELNTDAIGRGALYLHAVSSDHRYLLATGYKSLSAHPGMPFPHLEKTYIIDLESGKPIVTLDTTGLDMRTAQPTAIFPASRQVLVVTRPLKSGVTGMYAFNFDDKPPREMSAAKNIPNWQTDGDNTIPPNQYSRITGTERNDFDRLAFTTWSGTYKNILDPSYENSPQQIFAFWNSATPIRVFASDTRTNRPTNVRWSRDGMKLAFTSGANLYLWEPQTDGGEFQMPKDASSPDF